MSTVSKNNPAQQSPIAILPGFVASRVAATVKSWCIWRLNCQGEKCEFYKFRWNGSYQA